MRQRNIVLAAGGSGGHVFPALALSESLITRGWTVFLVTDKRGYAFAKAFPKQVQKLVIDFPNPWSGGKLRLIYSIWCFVRSLVKITVFIRKVNTTLVVGFGGYPAAATMLAASILRIPSIIHEQNSVLGRVNRFFLNRVKLIVFGIKPLNKPSKRVKMLVLGNPIRKSILQVFPREYSQLTTDTFVILVLGGSQGASFVSSLVCNSIGALPEKLRTKIRIIHQCRPEDLQAVQRQYAKYEVNSDVKIFFDDLSNHLNAAHLVISRSGASSLSEFCIFGRPSILIPLPSAAGNHQAKNAFVMKEAGASLIVFQGNNSLADLSDKILYILKNFQIANDMSISAKKLAKPDAAEKLVDELEKLNKELIL